MGQEYTLKIHIVKEFAWVARGKEYQLDEVFGFRRYKQASIFEEFGNSSPISPRRGDFQFFVDKPFADHTVGYMDL